MIHIDAQPQEDPNDPWLDMSFDIMKFDADDTDVSAVCKARTDDHLVGFELVLPRFWNSMFDENGEPVRPTAQSGTLRSIGAQTTALANWVSQWESDPPEFYDDEETPPAWDHPAGEIRFAVVHLGNGAIDLAKEYGRLKFFHEHDPYFEMFVHVDAAQGQAAVNEKDPSYRSDQKAAFLKAWGVDHV